MNDYHSAHFSCRVIDVFNTSIGVITIVGFTDSVTPLLGDLLISESGENWRIVGIGKNWIHDIADSHNIELLKYKAVVDFVIRPIGHEEYPKKGEIITFERARNIR